MRQISHPEGGPGGSAGWPSWQALNADRRGDDAISDKPSLTVSDAAAQLTRAGLSWSALGEGAVVSFAFRATSGPLPLDVSGFSPFTTRQIQATLTALQAWSDVADITFIRQDDGSGYSDDATILFGNYSSGADGAAAFAALPGSTAPGAVEGDVWVNASLSYNAAPAMWGYGQLTLVHEIGHAIGLLHAGDYDAEPGVAITYGRNASYYEDSNQYTVMSYFGEGATGAFFGSGRYASAPMLDDIAAAQRLYGANYETRTGDTVYGFNSTAGRAWFSASAGSVPVFAVWDAGGSDTFDFSGYSTNQVIDLRQGGFSNVGGNIGNVSIAVGTVIENAIGGAGDEQFFGGSGDNRFTTGAGHNRVDGGLGSDTLVLGGLQAAYTITWNGPDCFVSGPGGSNLVRNVEYLEFSDALVQLVAPGGLIVSGDITDDLARGSGSSDTISGSDGNDQIYGLGGHDQLIGGRGDDFIDGGGDNDIIYVDAGDDVLSGGEGTDTLDLASSRSGVVLDLEAGLMAGSWSGADIVGGFERVVGSRFDDRITGDAADNYIQAFGGVDVLHGGGGDDELTGSWVEAGGAEDLVKRADQANGSISTAVSLDQSFDRLAHEGVPGFGQPHATVIASTHGGYEYYAFTVGANSDVNFDVDGASFDSVIRIFNAAGVEIARNDDRTYDGDGGSPGDSFLNFRLVTPGTYYVQVGAYASGSGETVVSAPPVAGESYTLHVTVPDHVVQPTYAHGSELFGDDGDDILRGTEGRDVLDGGGGDDTIFAARENDIIRGGGGWDTLHLIWGSTTDCRLLRTEEGEYLLKGPEGADRLSGIEVIRFGDGVTVDLARLYSLGAFDGRPEGRLVSELLGGEPVSGDPLVLPAATANDEKVDNSDEQVSTGDRAWTLPFTDPEPALAAPFDLLPLVTPPLTPLEDDMRLPQLQPPLDHLFRSQWERSGPDLPVSTHVPHVWDWAD
ncbi:M10 family metallopeptidase C-terminal domain-containing protein [Brevundimonas sp.]|uniref:M10 family metallopeptidase C-terminal domain-containing protein n=1 Tax=Brevundimonas sp. TaxID=1871086 RepID=UPI002D506184|nr:M10 family metallopeptidase C-terminal domain-containing protein [Brevundimonas sp.]HYC68834.1 M10 family metallopeptidase C-terminal domain-containing protein [Brevundimonas sp.]